MAQSFIKHGPSKKERIQAEIDRLEAELLEYDSASDSQVWHKKARIKSLKKKLQEPDASADNFNAGTDKVNDMKSAGAKEQDGPMHFSDEQVQQFMANQGR